MTPLHFNALDEQTRGRLISALRGAGEVQPILSRPERRPRSVIGWGFLALLWLCALFIVLQADYGHLFHNRQSAGFLVAYAVLLFLFAWSVLRAAYGFRFNRRLPFTPGVYVFPADLIVAEDEVLRVHPLAEMQDLRVAGGQGFFQAELVFADHIERFVLVGPLGQQRLGALHLAWEAARSGAAQQDLFAGLRGTALWHDLAGQQTAAANARGLRVRPIPAWLRRPALLALPLVLLALPIWFGRNYLSDESAFARAREPADDTWAVEAYIGSGGRHVDEAREVLLPAAAFRKAQRTGDPLQLRGFWTEYPRAPQVPQAKAEAYQVAFTRAQTAQTSAAFGTFLADFPEAPQAENARSLQLGAAYNEAQNDVTALRAFIKTFPQAPQVPNAQQDIRTRYQTVRTSFEEQAGRDRSMRQFMTSLIDWLEQNGASQVQVRFRAPTSTQLEQIDAGIRVGGSLTSGVAPIAPHFSSEQCAARELSITTSLGSAFAAIFPRDVMTLQHLGRVDEAAPPAQAAPTIDVSYSISPSGAMYQSMTDARVFVGINVEFRIEMTVPGGVSHSTRVSVRPPQTFSVESFGGFSSDSSIYSTMADRAFARLSDELRRHFFREGTPAYQAALPSD